MDIYIGLVSMNKITVGVLAIVAIIGIYYLYTKYKVLKAGNYVLSSNGLILDVSTLTSGVTAFGNSSKTGSSTQVWTLAVGPSGWYINASNGSLQLNVFGNDATTNAKIGLWSNATVAPNAQWVVANTMSGYTLKGVNSGLYLAFNSSKILVQQSTPVTWTFTAV